MEKTLVLIDGTFFMGYNDAPEIFRITELEEIIISSFANKKAIEELFLYIGICTELPKDSEELLYRKIMGSLLKKGIYQLSYFRFKIRSNCIDQGLCRENIFIDMIKDIQESSQFIIKDYFCIGDKRFDYNFIPKNRIMEKDEYINSLLK